MNPLQRDDAQIENTGVDVTKVDRRQLRALFRIYKKLDFRTKSLTQATGRKAGKEASVAGLFFIYGLNGVFIGMLAYGKIPVFLFSLIAVTFTSVMVSLSLIAEASTLLFNPAESDVLGHLPINSRTYFAAKCLNALYFIALITVPLNIVSLFTGLAAQGATVAWPFAHAVSVALAGVFFSGCVIMFYAVLMRYVKKERVTSVITYSQIFLTLIFIFGYQLLPRLSQRFQVELSQPVLWLIGLFPPAWFASLASVLQGRFTPQNCVFAAVGIAASCLVLPTAVRRFSQDYQEYMLHLSQNPFGEKKKETGRSRAVRPAKRFWFIRRGEEQVGFELITRYLARDPDIKQRLLPTVIMMTVMPLVGLFTQEASDPWTGNGGMFAYMPLCFLGLLGITALETLLYSRSADAADLFRIAPMDNLGRFYSGIRKAFIVWMFIPCNLALFGVFCFLWKNPLHAALHVAPWFALGLAFSYASLLWHRYLPLSRELVEGKQAKLGALMLLLMSVMAILAILHGLSYSFGYYWYFLAAVTAFWLIASTSANYVLNQRRSLLLLD